MVHGGTRGPPRDVADHRPVPDAPADGGWAGDHAGALADLRRPDRAPGD